MSWAAHNPEKYDEIVRKGILKYIERVLTDAGFEVPGEWLEGYDALVESAQAQQGSLYTILLNLSSKEINDAEVDYFGNLADQAKEASLD